MTDEPHIALIAEEDILDAFCLYVMRQVENDPRLVKALTHALAAAWGKAFHDKQYLIEHVVEALRGETQDAAEYWRRLDEGKRIAEAGALRQPRQRRTSQNPNTGWW